MSPKTENPWNIESIYTLHYFICPSCGYKHVSKQNLVCHAFETHPESVNYLKNIKDGSLCDVLCPWDSKNYNNDDDNNSIDISEVIPIPEQDIIQEKQEESLADSSNEIPDFSEEENTITNVESEDEKDEEGNYPQLTGSVEYTKVTGNRGSECYLTKDGYLFIRNNPGVKMQNVVCQLFKKNKCKAGGHIKYSNVQTKELAPEMFVSENPSRRHNHGPKKYNKNSIFLSQAGGNLKPESDTNKDLHEDQIHQENNKVSLEGTKSLNVSVSEIKDKSKVKENSSKKDIHTTVAYKDIQGPDPICASCGNSYSQDEGLVSHIRTFHEGRGKLFTSEEDVQMFVSELHERNRNLKCDFCGKQFSFPNVSSGRHSYKSFFPAEELRKHIQTVHEKLKEFICQTCGGKFSTEATLKRHVYQIHLGNKDHQCDFCGKSFSHSSNLKRHVEGVHKGCKYAKKKFSPRYQYCS